jgi:hypothetical protein
MMSKRPPTGQVFIGLPDADFAPLFSQLPIPQNPEMYPLEAVFVVSFVCVIESLPFTLFSIHAIEQHGVGFQCSDPVGCFDLVLVHGAELVCDVRAKASAVSAEQQALALVWLSTERAMRPRELTHGRDSAAMIASTQQIGVSTMTRMLRLPAASSMLPRMAAMRVIVPMNLMPITTT